MPHFTDRIGIIRCLIYFKLIKNLKNNEVLNLKYVIHYSFRKKLVIFGKKNLKQKRIKIIIFFDLKFCL